MENAQNPYVGPRPFKTGETLYGRDQEIYELLDLLIAERIVLLYSPSGAGKTSLIQAGLLPQLEEEDFQVLPVIRVSLEPPPEQKADLPEDYNRYVLSALLSLEEGVPEDRQSPLSELAHMTLTEYVEQFSGVPTLALAAKSPISPVPSWEREGVGSLSASPTAKVSFSTPDSGTRIVLIFDQFEEILTVDHTDRAAKIEFFTQLGALLRNRDHYALFAMREEFPAGLDPYLRHIPTRLNTTFRLELLGVNAAQDAMQEPARQAGIPFTATAATKLISDLRTVHVQQPDGSTQERPGLYVEPVQLQVVCHRLWNHLPQGTIEIRETDIRNASDVNSALSGYYADRVAATAKHTGIRKRAIREWFDRHLITEQGIRGQVLRGSEQSQGLDNRAIAPLVDAHLVRAENRRGATWYELAHDRLIDPVRTNNAEWFRANLSTLQQQAALWERQNRSKGLLLRDEALQKAEQWAANHQEDLLTVEQEFLHACREVQAQARRERRKNQFIQALAVVAVIISVVAGYFYFQAEKRAEEARLAEEKAIAETERALKAKIEADEARAKAERLGQVSLAQSLAAQAVRQQTTDRGQDERAALLVRQAFLFNRRNNGHVLSQVDDALRTILGQPHFSVPLNGHDNTGNSVAFSPDSKTLASGSEDATIRLWDLRQPDATPVVLTGHHNDVFSVAFSPDGQTLASGSEDATIRLWDLRQPDAAPVILAGHDGWVFSVAFSPDGQTLASGSEDATIRLWDLRQPDAAPVILAGHNGWVFSVAFSPDGQTLASGSEDATIRLWDLRQPDAAPVVLTGHDEWVRSVAVSPDGQALASGSDDATIRVWWLTEALSEHVCQKVLRNLTFDEWQQFVSRDVPYKRTCPNLPLHPSVLEAGGQKGDVEAAIAFFQRILELDPGLDLDPQVAAQKSVAPSLFEKSEGFAKQGRIQEALAGYAEAQSLDPTLKISASSWNTLCWNGSLWGYAADVLSACENAVASDPTKAEFRDSRGLARALTGDFDGAIEDFQVFVDWWGPYEERKAKRQRWIEALQAGENPFTPEVLEALRNE